MFSWNISRSAEAMFSRWAVKRICQFLLKKKLGKFLLGDIDLNQLDVQLGAGIIQLADVALNVEYINEKIGTAAVLVKEGTIGLLKVTMPWKEGGCRIELEEVEIVLVPRRSRDQYDEGETCPCSKNTESLNNNEVKKLDDGAFSSRVSNASVKVHEGVKTIAKLVKWLLTSFHVKIMGLIIAFDPSSEGGSKSGHDRMLVLRVSEAECGTEICDVASSNNFNLMHNVLGLSRLSNFMRFNGAVLELLSLDGSDDLSSSFTGASISDSFSGACSPGKMTTVLSGEKGGFSGSLKLSLPWRDGSLDISKVDADLHIEPLELCLKPGTIRSVMFMWYMVKGMGDKSTFQAYSSPCSHVHPSNKDVVSNQCFSTNSHLMPNDSSTCLLSESHLISDWVNRNPKDIIEEEPDFVASVDQFFECIDGLRSSQSALGNSTMWNWTCSVFSAITAASDLASGSVKVPLEKQHGETKLNAVITKVSVLLFFSDEDQAQGTSFMEDVTFTGFHSQYLSAHFMDLCLSLQVHAQEMKIEATVQNMQIDDHLYQENTPVDYVKHGINEKDRNVVTSMRKVQDDILSDLYNFNLCKEDRGHPVYDSDVYFQSSRNFSEIQSNSDDMITLFKTYGSSHFHVKINSGNSAGSISRRTSFLLKLAPFTCWVNFDVIGLVQDYLKGITNSAEIGTGNCCQAETVADTEGFSHVADQPKGSSNFVTDNALEGNVFLSSARIILCFPVKKLRDSCSYSSFNHFVAFEIISTAARGEDVKPIPMTGATKRRPVTTPCYINVNFSDLYMFFVRPVSSGTIGSEPCGEKEPRFSIEKIVSVVNKTGHLPLISVFWQGSPATGPWIAKKAKTLVSGDNRRSESSFADKSSQFASVASVKDNKDFDYHTRQEILLSSELLMHVQLPTVIINLDRGLYERLFGLLDQLLQRFSDSEPVKIKEISPLQKSFFVELDSLMLSLAVEPTNESKGSIFSELPGSWRSLTLQVDNFELLAVSNIGGIQDTSFLHIAHHQGSLRGSTTEGLNQEFVLISCSNSATGRGNGEASNVLSLKDAGSVIMNMWDPEENHNYTSITVKCATIVAVGGRLDWFVTISSFFTLKSSTPGRANDRGMNQTSGSSFSFTMIDVGLSYEPFTDMLNSTRGPEHESVDQNRREPYVACLLAASSLKVSNVLPLYCKEMEYKIRVQDIGFLISTVSEHKSVGRVYSAWHLKKIGYVKIGQEALVQVFFRTNCENGRAWQVECTESHIILNTCHDTTMGLMRLSAQLQILFAPDMGDYAIHLEKRWNNVQLLHENNNNSSPGACSRTPRQMESSGMGEKSEAVNLMDVVCDDIFHLDGNSDSLGRFLQSKPSTSAADSYVVASWSAAGEESDAEFIDEYFSEDLHPPSVLNSEDQTSGEKNCDISEVQSGNARWYTDRSLNIIENHASEVDLASVSKSFESGTSRLDSDQFDVDNAEGCIVLKNMNVSWGMHGGSDWSTNQNASAPSTRNCSRDSTVCLELALSGIGVECVFYPDGEICTSKACLTIQDLCLNDRSANAPWKLVLGYHRSRKHPRKSSSDAVKLNLETFRPNPSIRVEENRLRIGLLPMRLHLHQRQLDFLSAFFGGDASPAGPVQATNLGFTNSAQPFQENGNPHAAVTSQEAFLPYFQKFDIQPFTIRVDYHPCRVDLTALRGGKYVELVNLVPWKGVELQLKGVQGVGHYGWNSVLETIVGEWLEDISHNQIHKILKGLPPIKSLVSVSSGAAKLVSLPVKSYGKDHGLLRGMQRGTFAFLRSISIEAIELGVHLSSGAHNALLQAEYLLANIPPSVPWQVDSKLNSSVKANQPIDAQQGLQQACQSISDGFGKSASALVQAPLKRYQRGAGVGSTLVTTVQSVPAAAVAPASAAARAVRCALLGFRNSLDPEHMKESVEKYMGSSPPHG